MTRKRPPERDRHDPVAGDAAGMAGLVVAIVMGTAVGWRYAAAAGSTSPPPSSPVGWRVIGALGPRETAAHATREDPARPLTDLITLNACIASLGGGVYLLAAGSSGGGTVEALTAALGIASVVGAWLVVHTVYTTRYALLYYSHDRGGIDFNQAEPPAYVDFAYLAFTLGMTYQVSDTDLQTRPIRATALRHALLSYLLGAVVLATVINLVAGLGSNGH